MCSARLVQVHTIAWIALIGAGSSRFAGHDWPGGAKGLYRSIPFPDQTAFELSRTSHDGSHQFAVPGRAVAIADNLTGTNLDKCRLPVERGMVRSQQ